MKEWMWATIAYSEMFADWGRAGKAITTQVAIAYLGNIISLRGVGNVEMRHLAELEFLEQCDLLGIHHTGWILTESGFVPDKFERVM